MDVLDSSWAKRAFLIPDMELDDPIDVANRYYSSANVKFTDSKLGGNIGINSRYQFTRYSDIRVPGRLAGREPVAVSRATGNHGLGRYSSEVYDDNSRAIYMQFGVPKFNSLINFLRRATDYESAVMVKSGRTVSPMYNIAKGVTTIGLIMAAPLLTIPLAIGAAADYFYGRPTAKFYTLKPTMHSYWTTVTSIVNIMAVNKNIVPKIFNEEKGRQISQPVQLDEEYMQSLYSLYPDMFNPMGMIDVYAVANRAQRLANQTFMAEFEALNQGTSSDYRGWILDDIFGIGTKKSKLYTHDSKPTLMSRISEFFKFGDYSTTTPEKAGQAEMSPALDEETGSNDQRKDSEWWGNYRKYFDSEFSDGSAFAVFRVDETGSVSDSFSNSAVESDLSNKINSMSSEARQARFTFADGNLIDGLGNTIANTAMDAAKWAANTALDTAAGAAAGLTLGLSNIPLVLSGIGYIDIPKNWQSASANLARLSYSMDLISPYNNPISQMQDIYIPLAMILAGAMPRSTGAMSYGAPYICSLYDRGRAQIKTGLIESLSIERGITSLPFSRRGEALGLRVTFSVLDLTSIMHMPVSTGGLFGNSGMIGEDSVFGDYLAVLAGMDLASQIYPMSKAAMNLKRNIAEASRLTSPAWLASWTKDTMTSGIGQWLTLGSGHIIEAASRGSELTMGSMRGGQ